MKRTTLTFFALLLLGPLSLSANAVTVTGIFLVDDLYSLIHNSASPNGLASGQDDFLRWDPNQTITLDLSGGLLTVTSPQSFTLTSNNFDTANFTITALSLDLSGPNGFAGGTLDYELSVISGPYTSATGTFTFDEALFGNSPFNTSTLVGSQLEIFGWGGDAHNDVGIDFGIKAVVPIPGAVLLLAPALLGLGFMRRR